jgi:hypothetical protein
MRDSRWIVRVEGTAPDGEIEHQDITVRAESAGVARGVALSKIRKYVHAAGLALTQLVAKSVKPCRATGFVRPAEDEHTAFMRKKREENWDTGKNRKWNIEYARRRS